MWGSRHDSAALQMCQVIKRFGLEASVNMKSHFSFLFERKIKEPDFVVFLPNSSVAVFDLTVKHIRRNEDRMNMVTQRECEKARKYKNWHGSCDGVSLQFHPVAITTTGQIAENTLKVLFSIAKLAPIPGLFTQLVDTLVTCVLRGTHTNLMLGAIQHQVLQNTIDSLADTTLPAPVDIHPRVPLHDADAQVDTSLDDDDNLPGYAR